MRVKALARGVYGRLIDPGQVFDIASDDHLGSWMEPVEAKDRERLADRLKAFSADRRAPARPDVPLTTGPGVPNALRDPIQPRGVAAPGVATAPAGPDPRERVAERGESRESLDKINAERAAKPKPEPAPKADKG